MYGKSNMETYITICKIDGQWEFAVCLRELKQGLCINFSSVEFSSVAQSCPTLCDSMNHSMPGLPVHHKLPEFTQTHVHRVGGAILLSHKKEHI